MFCRAIALSSAMPHGKNCSGSTQMTMTKSSRRWPALQVCQNPIWSSICGTCWYPNRTQRSCRQHTNARHHRTPPLRSCVHAATGQSQVWAKEFSSGIKGTAGVPECPMNGQSDWDLEKVEAKLTPWALCHIPQAIPEQICCMSWRTALPHKCQDPRFSSKTFCKDCNKMIDAIHLSVV